MAGPESLPRRRGTPQRRAFPRLSDAPHVQCLCPTQRVPVDGSPESSSPASPRSCHVPAPISPDTTACLPRTSNTAAVSSTILPIKPPGIHFTPAEIERLGAASAGVYHRPSSNIVLASGICPVNDLLLVGARVGLGVDGSASNDCSNLMQEIRQALLIGRLRYGAAVVTHRTVLQLATGWSADLLGRPELGELRPGGAADIALFDLDELRFSGHGDPLAALVLCGASRVSDLMIAGVWRVSGGELQGVDMDALMHEHRRIAGSLTGE